MLFLIAVEFRCRKFGLVVKVCFCFSRRISCCWEHPYQQEGSWAGNVSVTCFYTLKEMSWIRYLLGWPFISLCICATLFISNDFNLWKFYDVRHSQGKCKKLNACVVLSFFCCYNKPPHQPLWAMFSDVSNLQFLPFESHCWYSASLFFFFPH